MVSFISPKVRLQKSKIHGKGLFATKKIKKGEIVVDYTNGIGKFINTKEVEALRRKGLDYMMQVDDDLFFAATNEKEVEDADFINHSCDPNCGIKNNFQIVTMRDIEPGEEITLDYAMFNASSSYRFKCNCKSKNCRKIVTGEDWKIKELQKKYEGYFADFLQKKIDVEKKLLKFKSSFF